MKLHAHLRLINSLSRTLCILIFLTSTFSSTFCFADIETDRLLLRSWRDEDIQIIHAMIQDPEVSYYLKHTHLEEYTVIQKIAEAANSNIEKNGYGYFVCALKDTGEVVGFVGLNYTHLDAPYFPCYTVSWIFGKKYWKRGYATEAAQTLISFGFEKCEMSRIFACTATGNIPSRNVMERIGMRWVDTFNFPGIDVNHRLSQQVLYRIEKD